MRRQPDIKLAELVLLTENEKSAVRECLHIIEEAQNLINLAAQALCKVRGFGNEWSALDNRDVKRQWHLVAERLDILLHYERECKEKDAKVEVPHAAE